MLSRNNVPTIGNKRLTRSAKKAMAVQRKTLLALSAAHPASSPAHGPDRVSRPNSTERLEERSSPKPDTGGGFEGPADRITTARSWAWSEPPL